MNENTTTWNTVAVLWPVALAGLGWLLVRAAQLLTLRVSNEQLRGVLARLGDAVDVAVREVQQVLVDRLKAASTAGTLTAAQGTDARQAALDATKLHLGARGLSEVKRAFGLEAVDVDRLLGGRIEAAVQRLKSERRIASDAGTAGDAVPFAA